MSNCLFRILPEARVLEDIDHPHMHRLEIGITNDVKKRRFGKYIGKITS